jgi:flagellar protein FliO/FliZ
MTSLSPRNKVAVAGALCAALALTAAASSGSLTTAARLTLGTFALGGLAWWVSRQQGLSLKGTFSKTQRLTVVQRVGLSKSTGVALIEVDGRSYLIVHGDGVARVRPIASRAALMAQTLAAKADPS